MCCMCLHSTQSVITDERIIVHNVTKLPISFSVFINVLTLVHFSRLIGYKDKSGCLQVRITLQGAAKKDPSSPLHSVQVMTDGDET